MAAEGRDYRGEPTVSTDDPGRKPIRQSLRATRQKSMEPGKPPDARQWPASRLLRFPVGFAYLALVAWILSSITDVGFLPMFVAVVIAAAFCTTLAIVWLTCWALREDARPGQFGLASLFFLTTLAAIYFGVIRWLMVHYKPFPAYRSNDHLETYMALAVVCLFLALVAVPFLLVTAETVVWAAVWIVRRPIVRRWLHRRRSGRGEQ